MDRDVEQTLRRDQSRRRVIGVVFVALVAFGGWLLFTNVLSETGGIDTSRNGPGEADDWESNWEPPPAPPTVRLQVTSNVDGAAIVVNGILTGQHTPAAVQVVEGETNTITLYRDGYRSGLLEVLGRAGDAPLITLEELTEPEGWEPPEPDPESETEPQTEWAPERGRIRIRARTPGGESTEATILVDGEPVSGTTPVEVDVVAGVEHHVTVRMPGFRDSIATLVARPWDGEEDTREVMVDLTPDRERNRLSTFSVTTVPRGAEVTLNGEVQAGRLIHVDTPGHHLLTVTAADHVPWQRAFDSSVGIIMINAVMEPVYREPATVSITVEPEGAVIYAIPNTEHSAGGRQIGITSVENHELSTGDWTIRVAHGEVGDRQRGDLELSLEPGDHRELRLRLADGVLQVLTEEL